MVGKSSTKSFSAFGKAADLAAAKAIKLKAKKLREEVVKPDAPAAAVDIDMSPCVDELHVNSTLAMVTKVSAVNNKDDVVSKPTNNSEVSVLTTPNPTNEPESLKQTLPDASPETHALPMNTSKTTEIMTGMQCSPAIVLYREHHHNLNQ